MAETKRVIYYDQLSGNQPTNGDVIFVDNPTTGTHKMDLKSFVDAINNGFDSSIKSSGVSVSADNYSSIITNVNDQPVNSVYTYGAGLQSKVSNLPSNKAMTIINFAQKSTGGLGQVMLAVERNGSDDYLYFRTIGGSPAVWSSWVKVANNSDVEAVREALDNLDIETDKTLSISGKPADAKAAGDEINDLKADLNLINDGYYSLDLIADKFILRDNGQEANYTDWSATDFIEIPPHALAVYYGSANLTWGAQYDKNKSYVSAIVWNHQFSSLFNNSEDAIYFRTSGANADITNTKFKIFPMVDLTLTKTGYPADAKTVGDALALSDARIDYIESDIMSVIPSYYQTQIATKESTIRGHFDDCALNGDGLIFLTDTHYSVDLFTSASPSTTYNANNSLSLVKDVVAKCPIDKIVFGGDLVNTASDVDTMLLCMASFGTKLGNRQSRLRYCIGNHEYYTGSDLGATDKPTPSELYGAGIKYNEDVIIGKGDMGTYYFDNKAQKIRYFVVSCERDTELTISQVEWVLNAFLQIPDDYYVVVIGHAFISDSMTAFRGRHQQIVNALDKVKTGGTFNYNRKDYDYSALKNVTPVCLITGHTHIDGVLNSTGGIPCICTTTDSYALNYELVDGTPTRVERQKGTVNEQAFDVYQFDFTNRKIYATRIGYGSDREFSY